MLAIRTATPVALKKWRAAVEEMLALCETDGIDPRQFIESVVDTMGWFCATQGKPFVPGHVNGANARERFNKWLARQHAESHRGDTALERRRDLRLEAERVYVEAYALTRGMPHSQRRALASSAAREIDPSYTRCPHRRVIALSEFLHRQHRDLPDVLALSDGWKMRDVFAAVDTLLTP